MKKTDLQRYKDYVIDGILQIWYLMDYDEVRELIQDIQYALKQIDNEVYNYQLKKETE